MIKYKNGNKETIDANSIAAQSGNVSHILRMSGSKMYIDDRRVKKQEFKDELFLAPDAEKLYKNANTAQAMSIVAGLPGGYILGWQLANVVLGNKVNLPMTAIGVGLTVTSIVLSTTSNNLKHKSVSVYNSYYKKSSVSIDFGLNSGGVGFAVKF